MLVSRGRERLHPDQDISEWDSLPDEDLVRLAKEDQGAFGVLYQRYLPEITGFIRVRSGENDAVADDLASMVFTKALAALPQYTTGPFRAWLYRIARNTIIDDYRRTRLSSSIDRLGGIEAEEDGPLDRVVAADAAQRLHAAISTLKPDQQDILRLRLHGFSIAEIASRLGMTENAVKSAQYRAFVALRKHPGVRP